MRSVMFAISRIESALIIVSRVVIILIMTIVSLDVAMRYAFGSPIVGVSELVGMYLMVALFFFSISGAFAAGAHIRVDLLLPMMPPKLRRASEAICCALAAPVFVAIAMPSGFNAWEAYRNGDVLAGLVAWPTWIPPSIVALGCGVMAARLAFDAVAHLIALLGGAEIVPLPDVAGHEGLVA